MLDCCQNTDFIDTKTEDVIHMNMSPKDIKERYPNSNLADYLKDEPRFLTFAGPEDRPEQLGNIFSDAQNLAFSKAEERSRDKGAFRGSVAGGSLLKLSEWLKAVEAAGADMWPVTVKLGRQGKWHRVNEGNIVDCDALQRWGGDAGVIPCCQIHMTDAGLGNFGLPEHAVENLKSPCRAAGYLPENYLARVPTEVLPSGGASGGGSRKTKRKRRKTKKKRKSKKNKYKKRRSRRRKTKRRKIYR